MYFLFRLDLSHHAGAGKKIGIWYFATKHGPSLFLRRDSGQAEARTVARRDEPSETTAFACIGTGSSKSNYQFDAICLAG